MRQTMIEKRIGEIETRLAEIVSKIGITPLHLLTREEKEMATEYSDLKGELAALKELLEQLKSEED